MDDSNDERDKAINDFVRAAAALSNLSRRRREQARLKIKEVLVDLSPKERRDILTTLLRHGDDRSPDRKGKR